MSYHVIKNSVQLMEPQRKYMFFSKRKSNCFMDKIFITAFLETIANEGSKFVSDVSRSGMKVFLKEIQSSGLHCLQTNMN